MNKPSLAPVDIPWLDPSDRDATFPNAEKALQNPEGLLAAGGNLSVTRLLNAYRSGIFPWYKEGQPILWWSPNPRGVLYTNKIKISTSLRRTLRKHPWHVTFDSNFKQTVMACAAPRRYSRGTWITADMIENYTALHQQGYAHSVELWNSQKRLVGGIYGVLIGRMFFGESMFSFQSNASKVALVYLVAHLCRWGFPILDCQLPSAHLSSLGAEAIPRKKYIESITPLCNEHLKGFVWKRDTMLDVAHWIP